MESRGSNSHIRNSKTGLRPTTSGKLSRNPFINFLRDFRKSNQKKLPVIELTKRGGQLWRGMTDREKSPYINLSKQAPSYKQTRRRRGRRRRGRRRRRRRGRRRSRSRSRSESSSRRHKQSKHEKQKHDKKKKKFERPRRKSREERKRERVKERSSSSGKKGDKSSHGSKEKMTACSNKKPSADEYELKYKNSRYEDNRDFI